MKPTYLIPNGQSFSLILCFMSSLLALSECSTVPKLDPSDHLGLHVIELIVV